MSETAERSAHRRRASRCFCLQRLRLADGEPLAIEISQLSFQGLRAAAGRRPGAAIRSIALLETKFGLPLMEAEQELEAGSAGAKRRSCSRSRVGSSVLYTRRITYTDRNQPIEYAKSVYCGDQVYASTPGSGAINSVSAPDAAISRARPARSSAWHDHSAGSRRRCHAAHPAGATTERPSGCRRPGDRGGEPRHAPRLTA